MVLDRMLLLGAGMLKSLLTSGPRVDILKLFVAMAAAVGVLLGWCTAVVEHYCCGALLLWSTAAVVVLHLFDVQMFKAT